MTATAAHALVRLGQDSERSRRASERLFGVARVLESAVRRSLPYLVRTKVPVVAEPITIGLYAEIVSSLRGPLHVSPLRAGSQASPAGRESARDVGALVLDGEAVARGLDGVLGGGKGDATRLDPGGLSPPQTALATRLARGLIAAFDEVLARIGTHISLSPDASPERQPGLFAACVLRVGDGEAGGRIVLLLPAAAIAIEAAPVIAPKADPRAAAALAGVEVDLVAELGRVRMPFTRLAALKVGDVLRLPLAVETPARVLVGGRALFAGKPTTRGAQIAIEIARHGD